MNSQTDYRIIDTGGSRSFPDGDAFLDGAKRLSNTALVIGNEVGEAYTSLQKNDFLLILLELDHECLGRFTGEQGGMEGSHVLGFSRFRMGTDEPSNLVELVIQPSTNATAKEAAIALFQRAGFKVSVCADRPGRIVDRLIRPYFNSTLGRLDDGLAEADDLDRALKLGLGFARGPVEWLEASGLDEHYEVSRKLHWALGDPEYRPARRAQVAALRKADR